nr:CTP synthase-like [Ipomoea batatas]
MKKPTQPSLSIVTGQYLYILENERRGDYLGKTVQVVPHITDAMHEWIERVAAVPVDEKDGPADVCVIELGGTIGDIKLMPFIEALGQFSYRVGKVLCIALRNLMRMSRRNFLVLPCSGMISAYHVENIVSLYDVSNIWHVPLQLRDQKAHEAILRALNLNGVAKEPELREWTSHAELCDLLHKPVRVAMVGKYTGLVKNNTSYGFTIKLRKHIRTRRLEDVRQLGYDRHDVFAFGIFLHMVNWNQLIFSNNVTSVNVDAAILAVRVALAKGMSWEDLARMVKEEKKSGNPVAGLIDKLHLERNCMTLLLSNNLDEMDDDEKTQLVDKEGLSKISGYELNGITYIEGYVSVSAIHRTSDEPSVTCHCSMNRALSKECAANVVRCIARDSTDHHPAEQKIRHSQKLGPAQHPQLQLLPCAHVLSVISLYIQTVHLVPRDKTGTLESSSNQHLGSLV